MFRPNPSEVFTPRSAAVNVKMYVERTRLQERLQRAVNGTQHIAMFGDSGCGKTWLYQRYLKREKIPFRVVDLSIAVDRGMDHAFRDALTDGYGWTPTIKSSSRQGGAKAVIEAQKKVEEQYSFNDVSPFDKLITELSGGSSKPKFLVFDNLEQVSGERDLIRALARYIIRLDNPRFALSGVRFLLVGVVSDMKQMIANHDQAGTVVNRLAELPEVNNLDYNEALSLVVKGFKALKYSIEDERQLANVVFNLTFGNPQQIHSICYQIACEAQKVEFWVGAEEIRTGFAEWSSESLNQHKAMVEARLNKKETRTQRRNQVLHCIAQFTNAEFSAGDVESYVKMEFPEPVSGKQLGCYQILKGLSEGQNPLLVHLPSTGQFRFSHPKIRLAIRTLLCKGNAGTVSRLKDINALGIKIAD